MAIEQRKVGNLTSSNGLVSTDYIMLVGNVGTANANNYKITVTNFFGNLNVNVAGTFSLSTTGRLTSNLQSINYANTPASNTAVPASGRFIWWDENYLYVVANTTSNTIKRVALSTFS